MSLSVNLPSLTIGTNAYDSIEEYCKDYGQTVAILGGEKALAASKDKLKMALDQSSLTVTTVEVYGKDATFSNVERLKSLKDVLEADMIFAVGGGRALDTVKIVARDLEKPVFTFPTLASVCAATTAVSVMYHDNHEMAGLAFTPAPANHCFIDTQVIAEAPVEYLWAGIGDALSKEVEATFSARGRDFSFANRLGVNVVKGTNDKLVAHGKEALKAAHNKQANEALEAVTLEILGTTAYTSVLVDNDYNSNMAHAFYYGYTVLPQAALHLHGEVVSYGVLLLLTMDRQFEYRDRLREFMISINLPTSLDELEIFTDEDVEQLLDKAITMEDLVCSPYEITRDMFKKAIEDLESLALTHV